MPSCPQCGRSNLESVDGQTICTHCGTVVDDSNLVTDSLSFDKNSAGAAVLQGSFVGEGQSHAGGGRYRSGTTSESREQTIQQARRDIVRLASVLQCPEYYADTASRTFTLALSYNFTKGRKTQYVIACCLYMTCRQEKSSHMLIDFSDALNINVFTLGTTYLKLITLLQVRMPTIDPAIYVNRFAKHLEFGSEQPKVAKDALRLISRMNRDWMVQGRRPSGICGAALILAARMNNFRRSVREVVYLVKVADTTIHQRLQEFKETRSGELTVEEFRNIWLEQSHDPPSFGPKKSKKRKRVRDVPGDGEGDEVNEGEGNGGGETASNGVQDKGKAPQGSNPPPRKAPRIDADGFVIPDIPIDPALLAAAEPPPAVSVDPALSNDPGPSNSSPSVALPTPNTTQPTQSTQPPEPTPEEVHDDAVIDNVIESEISALLNEPSTNDIVSQLKAAHQAELLKLQTTNVSDSPDNFDDVDNDPEVQCMIMTEQESAQKERIWTEMNRDWLKEQELKRLKAETDARNGIIKNARKRKGKTKPRDSNSEDLASSPAESAGRMLEKRAYSKKINYKAIENLFAED